MYWSWKEIVTHLWKMPSSSLKKTVSTTHTMTQIIQDFIMISLILHRCSRWWKKQEQMNIISLGPFSADSDTIFIELHRLWREACDWCNNIQGWAWTHTHQDLHASWGLAGNSSHFMSKGDLDIPLYNQQDTVATTACASYASTVRGKVLKFEPTAANRAHMGPLACSTVDTATAWDYADNYSHSNIFHTLLKQKAYKHIQSFFAHPFRPCADKASLDFESVSTM